MRIQKYVLDTVLMATGAFMTGHANAADKPAIPPNIIFVFADQMRAHALGCYGNTTVPTPNIDAMASNGMTFENAISTWPVCSPYRAMLLSGRHPMANGTVSNDVGMRGDLSTVATACKTAGYKTGYIGKWHLEWNRNPFVQPDRRMGFDYWAVNNCTHQYMDHFYCTDTPEPVRFKGYDAVVQTDLAIDYITRNRESPFCLFLSWGPPHDPYNNVPQTYKDRVPLDTLTLRENVNERAVVDGLMARDKPSGEVLKRRHTRRAMLEDNERLVKEMIHGYYAHTVALVDCIGRLREALSAQGLAGNTILVFSSDHGDMLGSHRMSLKQMPFEESIRVPFVMEYPGVVPAGSRTDALLAPVDIMPTLLSLAGVPCPAVDGKDLAGAARGQALEAQDAVLITKMVGGNGGGPYLDNAITPWHGVRTKRHTYVNLHGHGPWLLYDNERDPYQLENLVEIPEFAELVAALERRMQELMVEAGHPGDPQKVAQFMDSRRPK